MMTNNRSVLLISLIALILAAFVPAVSALEVIYDEPITEYISISQTGIQTLTGTTEFATGMRPVSDIRFKDITEAQDLKYLVIEWPGDGGFWKGNHTRIQPGIYNDVTYIMHADGVPRPASLVLERYTDSSGEVSKTVFTIRFRDWDIGSLTGKQYVSMSFDFDYYDKLPRNGNLISETNAEVGWKDGDIWRPPTILPIKITEVGGIDWKHHLRVEEHSGTYYIVVNGFIDGQHFTSDVLLKKGAVIYSQYENPGERLELSAPKSAIDLIEIISPSGTRHVYPLFGSITPGEPVLRTGSVTMTDLNGARISGFEVTAVNAYTGEVYTTSTDGDVAYLTLPMDRTMRIRDPQTGVYEDAPVGYYYFFGHKSGYKMVIEEGIQVTVLPTKYRPYQFCDIPVTTGSPVTEKLRTGTVTMTDHNGTRISGFEVKAVNYYTGEVYTTSTDSDVAVITLPMDQTTTRRHPQTGEYVEVPVGYYKFFGYKPGYKMTNEDGIRVSVLPVEYQGSYQLCDIIVRSETGYLTGKHKFQLRSVADNSIIQTGTVSAQSATTGEWYNTTVVNGMATLILPYDTSDSISPYVGNYFVYGSSPGYLDTQEGVRVSVRPDTQDEIWGIYLTPIGGIPEPGYVKLRIQAITERGQGIPNAEIFIKGVDGPGWELWETYTASSTGYAEISVPENSTYDITVSATGYTSSSQRIEVSTEDPPLLTFMLYLSGWVTPEPTTQPTTQPTGWPTGWPTTQPTPTSGVPGDDGSEGFLSEAVRGIGKLFGVGFSTAKILLGMLLALSIGFTTAKKLRGGAAEFGLGLLGGTMLGVLVGLLPVWTIVVLLLVVGMYIGYRYVGGSNNG